MGDIERKSRRRLRRGYVQDAVLKSVAVAGVLSVALVAPNVLVAMKKLGMIPPPRSEEGIKNARRRLVEQGFLKSEEGKLHLTPKGERMLTLIELADTRLPKKRRWDKQWRMVIFDIPERKRHVRERMRSLLRSSGFLCIQDSVWLYPHDCEDLITLIKVDLLLGKEALYCIVDSLENDMQYRKHFDLL